jgi:hypothetical protein
LLPLPPDRPLFFHLGLSLSLLSPFLPNSIIPLPRVLHPSSFSFSCWVPYVLRPFSTCLCDVALCPDQSVLVLIFLSRVLDILVWVLICPEVLRSYSQYVQACSCILHQYRPLTTCYKQFWKLHNSCFEFT